MFTFANARHGAAVVVALSVLGTSGCTFGEPSPIGAGVGVAHGISGLEDVYGQAVVWGDCEPLDAATQALFDAAGRDRSDRQCAQINVPLDWGDPSGTDRIDLAVIRYAATGSKRLGSLLVNPGGPGAGGQDLATRIAAEPRADNISAAYDLIGFDPRGIGESSPLKCVADDQDLPEDVLFAQCLRDNPLAHHMGTSSVAKDMDAIRVLVGDNKLNYLGYSYGTVLGATYASLFPGFVGRMVLDSATDAQWAGPISRFDQNQATEVASGELGASCVANNRTTFSCAWTELSQLRALRDRLAVEPWTASDGTVVGDAFIDGYVSTTNYSVNGARIHRLELLAGAASGDQASIDAIAADQSSSEVGLEGLVVSCFSRPAHPDIISFYDYVLDVTGDQTKAAAEVEDLDSQCAILPEEGTDITDSFNATGSNPILVVGVTGDHATPYPRAVSLVAQLGTARLLTLNANQHGASYLKQNATCVDELVDSYLLDGQLPAVGTVCQLDTDRL